MATLSMVTATGVTNNAKALLLVRRSANRVLNCSHSCPTKVTYVVASLGWIADNFGKCA
jgi:hypothetical protein